MSPRSTIVTLGRALASAISPLTGTRATGYLKVRAAEGTTAMIDPFEIFQPVVEGARVPHQVVKVSPNPQGDNGRWVVDDSGNTLIPVVSNIGGSRHNFPDMTRFVPELPIDDLLVDQAGGPVAAGAFTGGSDADGVAGIQDVVIYETMDGPTDTLDLRRSGGRAFPLVVLAFDDMTPADGIAVSQIGQQATLGSAADRMFAVTYTISIVVSKTEGEFYRRHQGLIIADEIAALINNATAADPGELLSAPSGLQIKQLIRESGQQDIYQKFFIYTFSVSAMRAITRTPRARGVPWLRTKVNVFKPQSPPLVNQGPAHVVTDMEIDMTPDQLDLAVDGLFTRPSVATLWDGIKLHAFQTGERRVLDLEDGVYLEPAVVNALGVASTDLTVWTVVSSAMVLTPVDADPLDTPSSASVVVFGTDPSSGITFGGLSASLGLPLVFSVFARSADGTKQRVRLAVNDGLAEQSQEFEVTANWERLQFECIPQSNAITVALKNKVAGGSGKLLLWGAQISNAARWGAEWVLLNKAKDTLVFRPRQTPSNSTLDTPINLLQGKWRLEFATPEHVPPDLTGTGLSYSTVLLSVGNGSTDLVRLQLYGTPSSGGASLELWTRSGGLVVFVPGVQWHPGDTLHLDVDAAAGKLSLLGSIAQDGVIAFPPYASQADLVADFLTIGDSSDGSAGPVPGFYTVVANGGKVLG